MCPAGLTLLDRVSCGPVGTAVRRISWCVFCIASAAVDIKWVGRCIARRSREVMFWVRLVVRVSIFWSRDVMKLDFVCVPANDSRIRPSATLLVTSRRTWHRIVDLLVQLLTKRIRYTGRRGLSGSGTREETQLLSACRLFGVGNWRRIMRCLRLNLGLLRYVVCANGTEVGMGRRWNPGNRLSTWLVILLCRRL